MFEDLELRDAKKEPNHDADRASRAICTCGVVFVVARQRHQAIEPVQACLEASPHEMPSNTTGSDWHCRKQFGGVVTHLQGHDSHLRR